MTMTYRERRQRKAERLREWAARRDIKADAAYDHAHAVAGNIPMGQPILTDHYSAARHRRDIERIDNARRASVEHRDKADNYYGRAASIEAEAAKSIYSDDPDAVSALSARIAGFEAQRVRIKTINAEARKGGDWAQRLDPPLSDREKDDLDMALRFNHVIGYPSYALANLSGKIATARKRLDMLKTKRNV